MARLQVYANEVSSRILDSKNDEVAYKALVQEYPHHPTAWIAYARYLHHVKGNSSEARRILEKSASQLHSLDLWLALVELEVEVGDSHVSKYRTLKAAIEDVGFDPRSLPLWDSFFALFVVLHNSIVKSLAIQSAEAAPPPPASSTAPLGSLEAQGQPYSERVQEDDDISRFFTSADQVDNVGRGGFNQISLADALLRHPLRDERVMDLPSSEVESDMLKSLSSGGDLNINVFDAHISRLALTPLIDLPNDGAKTLLNALHESKRALYEPAMTHIMKIKASILETIPQEAMISTSSPLHPEMDELYAPYWLQLLAFEQADGWRIREIDSSVYDQRMDFMFHWACNVCHHVPAVWFSRVQFNFVSERLETGLLLLNEITSKQIVHKDEMALVHADALELLKGDPAGAVKILGSAMTYCVENGRPIPAPLIYHSIVRCLRAHGEAGWEKAVRALLGDKSVSQGITDELILLLISLQTTLEPSRTLPISVLIDEGSARFPDSVPLQMLKSMADDEIPRMVDNRKCLYGMGDLGGRIKVTAGVIDLMKGAAEHSYFFSACGTDVQKWFTVLASVSSPGSNPPEFAELEMTSTRLRQLPAPHGDNTYKRYMNMVNDLGSRGLGVILTPKKLFEPTIAQVSGGLTDEKIQSIARSGHRLQQLLEILQSIVASNECAMLDEVDAPREKALLLKDVLERTADKARGRHLLNPVRVDQLKTILSDPQTLNAFDRWFRFQQATKSS